MSLLTTAARWSRDKYVVICVSEKWMVVRVTMMSSQASRRGIGDALAQTLDKVVKVIANMNG